MPLMSFGAFAMQGGLKGADLPNPQSADAVRCDGQAVNQKFSGTTVAGGAVATNTADRYMLRASRPRSLVEASRTAVGLGNLLSR